MSIPAIENIPDDDLLYYRVHKTFIVEGVLVPGAFKELGEGADRGMSTDWSKYSTPIESQNRARSPKDNGIISGNVGNIKSIGLSVVHAPIELNIAHTNIKGIDANTTEYRRKLLKVFSQWEIEIN